MLWSNKSYTQLPLLPNTDPQIESNEFKLEANQLETQSPRRHLRVSKEFALQLALVLQSLIFLAYILSTWRNVSCSCACESKYSRLYSPAAEFLREEIKVFDTSLGNGTTIYQGVGEDADRAWADLYEYTVLKLPKSEAIRLPNKTWPIENEPGYYIADLDVFHQLHCLDAVRQKIFYPDRVMPMDDPEGKHTSHCIDSLRQYIMCNIDVSVIPWQWNEAKQKAGPQLTYPHKCYNFEAIQKYAKANMIEEYNPNVFVDDGLPDPPIIYGP